MGTVTFNSTRKGAEALLVVEDAPFAPRVGEFVFLDLDSLNEQTGLYNVIRVCHVLRRKRSGSRCLLTFHNVEITLKRIIGRPCEDCAHWGSKCANNGSDDACEEFKERKAL